MSRVTGGSRPHQDPLAWLNLSTRPRPGTQNIALNQLAPVGFSLAGELGQAGQPALTPPWGALERWQRGDTAPHP